MPWEDSASVHLQPFSGYLDMSYRFKQTKNWRQGKKGMYNYYFVCVW
jgi:hypothetical protein